MDATKCLWMAKKTLISAFVIAHISATLTWVMPECPIRNACIGWAEPYIFPLGLWQSWSMFSPDPPTCGARLAAEVIDNRGIRYNFEFPTVAEQPRWKAVPMVRHMKYTTHLTDMSPRLDLNRLFAARHAVRQLLMPGDSFPVDVQLKFQVQPCPSPGSSIADGSAPKYTYPIGIYHFASTSEVSTP